MKVWFLTAYVNCTCIPLCYSMSKRYMINCLKESPKLYELYIHGKLWVEQIEVDNLDICTSAYDYFNMYYNAVH